MEYYQTKQDEEFNPTTLNQTIEWIKCYSSKNLSRIWVIKENKS